jgi:hypothetical protein
MAKERKGRKEQKRKLATQKTRKEGKERKAPLKLSIPAFGQLLGPRCDVHQVAPVAPAYGGAGWVDGANIVQGIELSK